MATLDGLDKYYSFLKKWGDGIHSEISFWNRWLDTKGSEWPEDFKSRMDPTTKLKGIILDEIKINKKKEIDILDVGSGPITCMGYTLEDHKIALTACDPLAGPYNVLLKTHNIVPPVITNFAMVEKLTDVYPKNTFDIVVCNNALDHCFDPIAGITEMMSVLKIGGKILLSHKENEAKSESYFGFHQWNLTETNNDFVIWNKENECNITKMYSSFAKIIVERKGPEKNWIVTSIEKLKDDVELRIYPKYIIDYGLLNYCSDLILKSKPIK